MPVHEATRDGKPGYQWGSSGHVYTYEPGNEAARKRAKQQAFIQGYAATGPHPTRKGAADLSGRAWRRPSLSDFTDEPWDELSAGKRRWIGTHFAWAPAGAETFGEFKLPYREPSSGKVNHNAVANALARLDATSGIPAAAKAKIRAKLQRLIGSEEARKQLTVGDVHVPTAMGTSNAQARRRRTRKRRGPGPDRPRGRSPNPFHQPYRGRPPFEPFRPRFAKGDPFPFEIVLREDFLCADAARLEKDAELPLAMRAAVTERAVLLRKAESWLRILRALQAEGVEARLTKRAADAVPLYDLVLRRAGFEEDARGFDDEDEEDLDLDDADLELDEPEDFEEDEEEDDAIEAAELRIVRKAAAEQKVLGVVMEPDAVDTQGDFQGVGEIERAAHQFMRDYRAGRTHLGKGHAERLTDEQAALCENYVCPVAMSVGGVHVPAGTWLQMWHVKDPGLWDAIEKGEITGFSFGGTGLRRPAGAAPTQALK